MTPTRTALLQRMPIFGALSPPTLELLVGQARAREVDAGAWFFREGDAASDVFVLESGRVEVVKAWQDRELRLCEFGAGDCFGEMALIDLSPRSAGVRALAPCSALLLGAGDLYALFERDPEQFALIQMNLARELSRRLRATDERLFRLWVGAETAAAPDFSAV